MRSRIEGWSLPGTRETIGGCMKALQYTLRLRVTLGAGDKAQVMERTNRGLLKELRVASTNKGDVVVSASQNSISCLNIRSGTGQSAEKKVKRTGINPTRRAVSRGAKMGGGRVGVNPPC